MVFPLPVGPVTRTIPKGEFTPERNAFKASSGKPSSLRSNCRLPLSRIRRTIFSPSIAGTAFTLKSIIRLSTLALIRPSWVFLRSAMFIPDIIFSLERMGFCILGFILNAS